MSQNVASRPSAHCELPQKRVNFRAIYVAAEVPTLQSEQRMIGGIFRNSPMRAAYHIGTQRNETQQTSHAKLLTQQERHDLGGGKRNGGIDEEFGGVVSGFPVDIDGAGEVRCLASSSQ